MSLHVLYVGSAYFLKFTPRPITKENSAHGVVEEPEEVFLTPAFNGKENPKISISQLRPAGGKPPHCGPLVSS